MYPGSRSRRHSQLAKCGCWDCNRRSNRKAVLEEHKDATGPRRMRVQATWTPEARSRTGSKTGSPTRHRLTMSPKSRTVSPTRHREAGRSERRGQERTRPGVAKQRDSKEIAKDNIVVGKIKEDGPWVAKGTVDKVFCDKCENIWPASVVTEARNVCDLGVTPAGRVPWCQVCYQDVHMPGTGPP